ncbi:MAG: hypothetical protein II199_00770 [Bacteroidaceae bacterium]|nr:hypothetical protein [Bacteroidaceae bacterium]
MTIAVDFDGTIVEDRYPQIGKERPFAVATLKQLMNDGHHLILWTVRKGERLDEAVKWCEDRGVRFFAVNKDFDDDELDQLHHSRKIKADLFIDDRSVTGLPDWGVIYQLISQKMTFEDYLHQKLTGEAPRKKRKWWF